MRTVRELDAMDRKLIGLLQADARSSATTLAKAAGLSRTAVQARIARLEHDGIIAGYTAVLGGGGEDKARALIALKFDHRPCRIVIDRFKNWPEIAAVYLVAGPVDAVVLAETDGPAALSRLIDRLPQVPGVVSAESTVVLDAIAAPRTATDA